MQKILSLGFLTLGALGLAGLAAMAAEDATDKPRQLKCECILASSGLCGNVIGNVGGASIVEWRQDFHVPPNKQPDKLMLNSACYRKRDVDAPNGGGGVCCDDAIGANENDIILKLFRGTLQP